MSTSSVVEPPRLTDADDAYANGAHVAASDAIVGRWPNRAAAFRDRLSGESRARLGAAYGPHERERLDWFLPERSAGPSREPPNGVAVFVHGGYWMRFSASDFSHLAAGAVDRGWLTVLPSYPLCPEASLSAIADSIRRAVIAAAELADGPIRLAGHSAGGHLVARLLCEDMALPSDVVTRLDRALSISGVHDLLPLLATSMNQTLQLDRRAAFAESPARQLPRQDFLDRLRVCAWVGADERPEFVRQNGLLDIWRGVGARVATHVEPGRHHFDVVDDLVRSASPMLDWWLGER